jgi:queuine/archaeosine tRNA-ribosyltransferase
VRGNEYAKARNAQARKLQKSGFVTQIAVVSLPEKMKPATTLDKVEERNSNLQTAKPKGLLGVIFCCVRVKGSA